MTTDASTSVTENSRAELPWTAGQRRFARRALALAIFTSAFLLFQVQLVLGKYLLPWFGGASAVWTTCLLFFQLLLLGGYVYAHRISSSGRFNWQGKMHLAFLGLSTAWILIAWSLWGSPILPAVQYKPLPESAPVLGILKLLLLSVGLPFLLLSSTGPLLQAWYARLGLSDRNNPPYFLYALSNVGSLLGLLSYPFVLEPSYRLKTQSYFWGAGFVFFALCCALCAWQTWRAKFTPEASASVDDTLLSSPAGAAGPLRRWLWFIPPMAGSGMASGHDQSPHPGCRADPVALGFATLPLPP